MKLRLLFTFFCVAVSSFSLSSCLKEGENLVYNYTDLYENNLPNDSSLKLVNVVNTGLFYNSSEVPEFQQMERVGDTLNVYIAANSNQVTDSMVIRYRTFGESLYVQAYPYFDPTMYYAQALCILTRKLQFVGDVDKKYNLKTTLF